MQVNILDFLVFGTQLNKGIESAGYDYDDYYYCY
jgi:hypothetical protein